MSVSLFRKAAVERLSSPEELDRVVTISVGGGWAALLGILLFCAGASVWAVTARLPTTATGSGMVLSTGGVLNVVSRGAGVVQTVDVRVGQHVAANEVVATIAQPTLAERARGIRQELDDVRGKYQQDLKLKEEESRIRLDALARQRANLERSISELTDQARLAAERIPAMEQLFAQGLVIRQQVLDARQALITLNAAAADRAAQLKQLDAQVFEVQTQIPVMNASMQLDIARRARQIAEAESDLRLQERVTAPYAGVVVELKVVPGGTVAASTPVVSIQPDSDAIEVLAYVSAFQAKDVRAGMETRIFPSTVKREEYGFMRGRVAFVAEYPATAAAVMRNIQNEQLVQTLTGLGPITEVRIALERDATTVSGFRWSSPGGPPIRISEGTIAIAEIVTQTRAPITLVVPILRKTLGL